MSISYKIISKFYGLLDIIYFKNNLKNPRLIILNKIKNSDSMLLEIAVGTAKNSILLAKNDPNLKIIGIDLSEQMLKIARKLVTKENIPNIEFMKMDGTNLQFNKETFDYIIVSLLLHELTEDVSDKIFNGCLNVLKNDGKIYILEWEEPKKILQKIMFLMIKLIEPKEYKHFMAKDLDKYFSKNGFKINSIEYGDYSKVMELMKI